MGFDRSFRATLHGAGYKGRLVSKVPVHRVEQLHGLFVRPDGVEDAREQSEADEEVEE